MKDYSKENLDVKHYRNGDEIHQVQNDKKWSKLTTGAWCYYNNDPEKGILYNWYAVNDPRGLAPEGWKIPTIEELETLDLSTGLPGGYRFNNGVYDNIGYYGYCWSSSEDSAYNAWSRYLYNFDGFADSYYSNKKNGFSVRCLRDLNNKNTTTMYKVNRPCLWFCKNDQVSKQDLEKYFNQEAVEKLIEDGFIEEVKKELPKSWDDMKNISGVYVTSFSNLGQVINKANDETKLNIFPTKAEAEACLALSQLCQLRDAYNGEPLADWCDWTVSSTKYVIGISKGLPIQDACTHYSCILAFKTKELRAEFHNNFYDLIKIASPLL